MRVLATYHSINCVAYAVSKSFKWSILTDSMELKIIEKKQRHH